MNDKEWKKYVNKQIDKLIQKQTEIIYCRLCGQPIEHWSVEEGPGKMLYERQYQIEMANRAHFECIMEFERRNKK